MNHKSGIVTRMYPECEDLPASSSVLTWRIVVRIIQNFSSTLKSLSLANNIGITIEVNWAKIIHNLLISLTTFIKLSDQLIKV